MVYVFVFLGEFGVELLNWQGVVRKFALTISSDDKIVCCSRASVHPLYEMADAYIDISKVEQFKQSMASGYNACLVKDGGRSILLPTNSLRAVVNVRHVEMQSKSFILRTLRDRGIVKDQSECTFIFSSNACRVNGCEFGLVGYRSGLLCIAVLSIIRKLRAASPAISERFVSLKRALWIRDKLLAHRSQGAIYELLDINNNAFKKIQPDMSFISVVENKLGWKITEPFILCQSRRRDIPQPSDDELPRDKLSKLLEILSGMPGIRVVLLSFNTGRCKDSYSHLLAQEGCSHYQCDSFPEQACLIHFASHCLFFTEGDLGSHIYVPPLIGKDVTMVAPRSIYQLDSAPIAFWNREVFRFGGQIIPKTSEEVFDSENNMHQLAKELLRA